MWNFSRRILMVWVLFGSVVLLTPRSALGQELLDDVRDAHRASRESIRTCSCRVAFTIATSSKAAATQSCSSQYWYSPTAIRVKLSEYGENLDYLWKDNTRKAVASRQAKGQKQVSDSLNHFRDRHLQRCDAWIRGLLVLNVPGTIEYTSLEQLIKKASRPAAVARKTVG